MATFTGIKNILKEFWNRIFDSKLNTKIGTDAGSGLTTGQKNINIGAYSGVANTTANYNVNIGHYAGYKSTGAANINIGHNAGYDSSDETARTGHDNINIGNFAGKNNASNSHCVCIGNNADIDTSAGNRQININRQFFVDSSGNAYTSPDTGTTKNRIWAADNLTLSLSGTTLTITFS
jgi:hypothetical protein